MGNNLFSYCYNNSINCIDPFGEDAGAIAISWESSMWWLLCADGPLPIGDFVFWGVLGILCVNELLSHDYNDSHYCATDSAQSRYKENNSESRSEIINNYGSTTASPPGPGNNHNKRNWEYKSERYIQRQLDKQNTSAHSIKREYLGRNAEISRYDLYRDKSTGQLAIFEKATGQLVQITDYFI